MSKKKKVYLKYVLKENHDALVVNDMGLLFVHSFKQEEPIRSIFSVRSHFVCKLSHRTNLSAPVILTGTSMVFAYIQ